MFDWFVNKPLVARYNLENRDTFRQENDAAKKGNFAAFVTIESVNGTIFITELFNCHVHKMLVTTTDA